MDNKNPALAVLGILGLVVLATWFGGPKLLDLFPVDARSTVDTSALIQAASSSPSLLELIDETDILAYARTWFTPTLRAKLATTTPYTIFLPVDQTTEKNLADSIVPGMYTTDFIHADEVLTSLSGTQLQASVHNGRLWINDYEIVQPDIIARNGVIHVVAPRGTSR